jgi:hypothetical protein
MIFSAPLFLYLLPLASLPVIFHLVLKQKKRTVVFSTLMFFHRVDPKLNTRRRIREWLLLVLRVLMITLLLLALSRPTVRRAAGRAGKLSLVAIVDNSGSMSAGSQEGDATRLECAREGARKLLSSLEPDADAAIVLAVEDSTVDGPESLTADRKALLECLDRIGPTEATGDAHRALAQAFKLLHDSTAKGGVVHVFSDLQQAEWGESSKRFETREGFIHVYLHRIEAAAQERGNVAVTGVQLPEQRIVIGQPYGVGLALRNNSDLPADIRVNCVDSRGEKSTQSVSLQSQQTLTVRLPVTMGEQGHHWLKAWVEGDGFAADNAAGIGLFCEGMGTVLFAGQPRQFGVLPMALCPAGRGQLTGLVTTFSQQVQDVAVGWASAHAESPGAGSSGMDEQKQHGLKPILLVTTWDWLAAETAGAAAVAKYVEEGGSLLVVPSLSNTPGGGGATWLGAKPGVREAHRNGVRLDVLNASAPFWREIGPIVGDVSAERIMAYTFCPVEVSSNFTALLGAGAGKTVLAHKPLGKGHVFVSGVAFSPRWSTLPLSGLGVVMAQRIAVAGASMGGSGRMLPLVAGERPNTWPAEAETQIVSLAGEALEWKGPGRDMPAFPRTGVFLATTGSDKCCISVRASDKEGRRQFVESSGVPILGPIAHTVVAFDVNADYAQYHAGQARAVELYIPSLLLLTLAVLLEGLLGASRVRSRGTGILPVSSWAGRLRGVYFRRRAVG